MRELATDLLADSGDIVVNSRPAVCYRSGRGAMTAADCVLTEAEMRLRRCRAGGRRDDARAADRIGSDDAPGGRRGRTRRRIRTSGKGEGGACLASITGREGRGPGGHP